MSVTTDQANRLETAATSAHLGRARGAERSHVGPDLSAVAARLAGERHLWEDLITFDPVTRYYARITAGTDWEAWLLTWLPGQGTQWHDHGTSSGSFVVLQGALTERIAGPRDPGGRPVVGQDARRLRPGQQRTFGSTYVHRVDNDGFDPAVSLHFYSPRLTVMTTYVVDGTRLEPVRTEQTGVDW